MLIACAILLAMALLLAMGRTPFCPCGTVRLFAASVHSPENSQQLLDWYSLTHVVHGLLFYALAWRLAPRLPVPTRLTLATFAEAGWEVLENTPLVIERYRAATAAWGYRGDSVLNSLGDIGCMVAGFALARRLPAWAAAGLAVALELAALALIRDNLVLNVLMLVAPNDAIRHWQGG